MNAKDYALFCLARSAYHSRVLFLKMRQKGFDPNESNEVIVYLQKMGYLDDRDYLARFVDSQKRQGYGPKMILCKLWQKQIGKEEAIEFLSFDQSAAIRAFLQKNNRIKCQERPKLISSLIRRGFDYSAIMRAIAGL